ncbi:hypothetical protein [Micromonospora aurantiaca]|uniref:hypothetical protein n=1 Tax=Micromonospora aurantiaca (nom. illeg.) TaxID=47850 RepID=UPI0011A29CA1|nr:hypothetical protein [Micromonospora aurantiaca]UFN92702.1 hypothetical protein LF814_22225 [Micromonospora aurantiaca]
MLIDDGEMVEDADGWCYRVDAVFVGPEDWVDSTRHAFEDRDSMYLVCEALSAAADESGQLLYFRPDVWYDHYLSEVMRTDEDPAGWSLAFDRFSSMMVSELIDQLFFAGWLAQGGNNSKRTLNWRLTIPPC